MSKSISILNETDHSGKADIAVNLAITIGLFEKKTLLIDNFQNIKNVSDILQLDGNENDIRTTRIKDLYFLNIPYDNPEDFNINFFEKIDESFEFVIINTPESKNKLFNTVLTATDWIVIPSEIDEEKILDLYDLIQLLKEQSKDTNFCYRIAGIVLNKFKNNSDPELNIFKENDIFFNAKIPEFDNINSEDFFTDIKSEFSVSYINFAIEVINRISN